MIMQLALRPYATAGVAVLGAGLIYVTPTTAPHIEQRPVQLAAAGSIVDLVNPIDAGFSALTGAGGAALPSVTDVLAPEGGALSSELSGVLPSLGDFSGTLADAADSTGLTNLWAILGALFDTSWPQWEQFFGPIILFGGIFVGGFVGILQGYWEEFLTALGIEPASALTAAATGALDTSALSAAVDPHTLADLGTALDPSGLADIGTVLSTSTIPDLGEILTGLMP